MKRHRVVWACALTLFVPLCAMEHSHLDVALVDADLLFVNNRSKTLGQIGAWTMTKYTFAGNNTLNLENDYFKFLANIEVDEDYNYSNAQIKNFVLPNIMAQWMRGQISPDDVLKVVNTTASTAFEKNQTKKNIIQTMARLTFDPKKSAPLFDVTSEFQTLKKWTKLGTRLFLIANMNNEMLKNLQKRHEKVFKLFQGTLTSADCDKLKPDPEFYREALSRFKIDPKKQRCCLLDTHPDALGICKELGLELHADESRLVTTAASIASSYVHKHADD